MCGDEVGHNFSRVASAIISCPHLVDQLEKENEREGRRKGGGKVSHDASAVRGSEMHLVDGKAGKLTRQ